MTWGWGCLPFPQDRILQSVAGPGTGAFGEGKYEGKQAREPARTPAVASAVSVLGVALRLGS